MARLQSSILLLTVLDLLTQATNEFRARGLEVEEINSKEDFIKNMQTTGTSNNTGKETMCCVGQVMVVCKHHFCVNHLEYTFSYFIHPPYPLHWIF